MNFHLLGINAFYSTLNEQVGHNVFFKSCSNDAAHLPLSENRFYFWCNNLVQGYLELKSRSLQARLTRLAYNFLCYLSVSESLSIEVAFK